MADVNEVLTAFRHELVGRGLARKPDEAGILPPAHIEPEDGAPAPGDREGVENDDKLVVTLTGSDLGEAAGNGYRRRVIVDVRYRAKGTAGLKRGRELDAAIADLLVHNANYGLDYQLGAFAGRPGVRVLQALIYSGLGRISASAERGYDDLAKYLIEVER